MYNNVKLEHLIVPAYINEKIVLDMLAIMEDGFSMVSQVNYTEHKENNSSQRLEGGVSTSATILSKLLKINISGELAHSGNNGENESVEKEKVHTNVSLLSKFRSFLLNEKILNLDFDVSKMRIGDFIEVEGELQKNPLINYMDIFVDVFRMADIFTEKPQLGGKNQAKNQKQQESETVRQIKSFADELKHTGTIDFILTDEKGTVVLSAQEQYLSNDNISEILGGRFRVLGKVIAICKNQTENIDLLRKTTLSVLPEEMLNEMFAGFNTDDTKQFNLPELKTKISGPAVIVIPIAIYA
ncbi:hypothetical protein MUB23_06185 [Cuneatibacter sp. NSJ-177]|uniref:DUF6414 family protein n=1 Tax=Cuneatibacter sp. NSJ-177 TaxID=2931401 RepID=UPI001FD3D5C9|nr:hypothetical protein [Cuneatibacter sp. NSJ-177]MCJ7834981.1 hypothetical protein [Cuneatibacter sp. NSJ-177]